jgi:hypothetical protein
VLQRSLTQGMLIELGIAERSPAVVRPLDLLVQRPDPQVFINGMVASAPRLPHGGVKHFGYGRELSVYGTREFVDIQTVWIGPAKGWGTRVTPDGAYPAGRLWPAGVAFSPTLLPTAVAAQQAVRLAPCLVLVDARSRCHACTAISTREGAHATCRVPLDADERD